MEEHNRKELAGFGEDEGYVVDVREGSVAERGGEGGGEGDEEERAKDSESGEDGWGRGVARGGEEEVDVTGRGGEE